MTPNEIYEQAPVGKLVIFSMYDGTKYSGIVREHFTGRDGQGVLVGHYPNAFALPYEEIRSVS